MANFLEKCINFYKKNNRKINILLLVTSFIFLYTSIYALPYYSDDLIYMNQWGTNIPIKSLNDIYNYQIHQYFEWGGRIVAHSILQVLFLLGKPIGAFLTTLVVFIMSYLITKIANKENRASLKFMCFVIGCIYFLNPEFKETILWTTGAANYLWTIFIVLLAIYPITILYKNIAPKRIHLVCVVFSFFAGWCNENISTTLVLFIIFSLVFLYRRDHRVYKVIVMELVLSSIGCALLILAPGNFARAKGFSSGLMGILYRGHGQINAWLNWLFPILLIIIICFLLMRKRNLKVEVLPKTILVWGLISVFVMIASPSYPSRATFGTLILLLIPLVSLLESLFENDNDIMYIISRLLIIGFIGTNISISVLQFARNMGVGIPG